MTINTAARHRKYRASDKIQAHLQGTYKHIIKEHTSTSSSNIQAHRQGTYKHICKEHTSTSSEGKLCIIKGKIEQ